MKNFAIVSVLLVCLLVVGATARSYALADLPPVSIASKGGVLFAPVESVRYAPGKFCLGNSF